MSISGTFLNPFRRSSFSHHTYLSSQSSVNKMQSLHLDALALSVCLCGASVLWKLPVRNNILEGPVLCTKTLLSIQTHTLGSNAAREMVFSAAKYAHQWSKSLSKINALPTVSPLPHSHPLLRHLMSQYPPFHRLYSM